MSVDKLFTEEALLRHNYFPFQKRMREEIPPVFTSKQLVPSVAEKLTTLKHRKEGYDQVEYLMTRHTNVSRPISIPHLDQRLQILFRKQFLQKLMKCFVKTLLILGILMITRVIAKRLNKANYF